MGNPEVNIIIPCYNMSKYLPQAIESALAQTYGFVRVVVVDDGSTEDISKVVESFGGRVDYFFQENRGQAAARNTGIENTQGEFLCFLDSDDIILPSKIELQVNYLKEHPEVDLVYGHSLLITNDIVQYPYAEKRPLVQWDDFLEPLSLLCPFPIHSALMRRKMLNRCGFFPGELRGRCEDWAFWIQCVLQGSVFAYSPDTTVLYRQHKGSMSGDPLEVAAREANLVRLSVNKMQEADILSGRKAKILSYGIRFVATRYLTLKERTEYDALLSLAANVFPEGNECESEGYSFDYESGISAPISYLILSKKLCDVGLNHLAFYCFMHAGDIRLLRLESVECKLEKIFDCVVREMFRYVSENLANSDLAWEPGFRVKEGSAGVRGAFYEFLEQFAPKHISHVSYLNHQLGCLEQEKGKIDEAITKYKRAVDLNPYYWPFYEDLTRALCRAGRKSEAEQVVQRLLDTNPDSTFGHYYLGKRHLLRFNFLEGMRHIKREFSIDPVSLLIYVFAEIDQMLLRYFGIRALRFRRRMSNSIANFGWIRKFINVKG